jgi:uncharacterized protein YegL
MNTATQVVSPDICSRPGVSTQFGPGIVVRRLAASVVLAASLSLAYADSAIAVAIILDTSGSMEQSVRDTNGASPKYVIARRALEGIADKLQKYAETNPTREIELCAVTFDNGKPAVKLPLGKFEAQKLKNLAAQVRPSGGTPLGNSLTTASAELSKSKAPKRHLFLITDGENTVGPDATSVWKNLKTKETGQELHLIAFDIQAARFNSIKQLGATVVGAADAPQLNTRIDYILEKKILLEDEEPAAKK